MAQRKRKTTYPSVKSSRRAANTETAPAYPRTSTTIDTTALTGRAGLAVGARVRIVGSGLYSGEAATIERFSGGVVPSAVVRTDPGHTRQVRTIDLEPIPPNS